MSNERKDGTDGMDPGDDEALWRLLGQARGPEVSPYFSRRVLREVALAGEKTGRVRGWLAALRRPRAAVWPGAVIVGVFWLSVVLTTNTPTAGTGGANRAPRRDVPSAGGTAKETVPAQWFSGHVSDPVFATTEDVAPQDVEVIADLDNLISREESRLWTEDTARF